MSTTQTNGSKAPSKAEQLRTLREAAAATAALPPDHGCAPPTGALTRKADQRKAASAAASQHPVKRVAAGASALTKAGKPRTGKGAVDLAPGTPGKAPEGPQDGQGTSPGAVPPEGTPTAAPGKAAPGASLAAPTAPALSAVERKAREAAEIAGDIPQRLQRANTPEAKAKVTRQINALEARRTGAGIKNPPNRASAGAKALGMSPREMKQTGARPKSAASTSAKPKPSSGASRGRYDWAGAEEGAKAGRKPPALDFSANTHKCYREKLKEVEKMARDGDLKALQAWKPQRHDGSPAMIDRWRKLVVIALKAKA